MSVGPFFPLTFRRSVPFAAFYYCHTLGASECSGSRRDYGNSNHNTVPRRRDAGSGSSTSYIRSSVDEPPIQLLFTLAGSIGVPDSHTATPATCELLLDPVTFRPTPSPHIHPRQSPSNASSTRNSSPVPTLSLNPQILGRLSSSTSTTSLGTATNPLSPPAGTGVGAASSGPASAASGGDSPPARYEHSFGAFPPLPSSEPWTWPIAEAVASRCPVLVPSLPAEVAEPLSRRAWGDIPRQAIVVPICAFEGDGVDSALPHAVLVLGINPRRPYDKDYEDWVDLFRMSLGVSLAAVLNWEAETQRAE